MEKRLRSSLQTSAEEFLSSSVKLPFKSSKSAIKTLIYTFIKPSSDLTSTLPLSLRNSISHSISQFKSLSDSTFTASPITPPAKRVRRSARNKEDGGVFPTNRRENERRSIVQKLQVYAYILRLCVFHPKNVFSVSDLLPAMQELHDNLILFESDSALLSEIANLCEEWWKGDLIGKENLISQSLPVILSRSLTLKKKVDVHRVYTIRDAFALFDFEDESIEDLKHLLIRCVISPLYLKTEEGRKFIAFLFRLSVQLTKELCAMIKSQIPFGRKSMLEAYGEIVFRAWKVVEGECKYEIENGFLQGLVEGAIYASSTELATSVRRMFWGFVNQRTTQEVEKLIFCLADPVIFRSLQVANSNVRQNALHLLLDLFPLEDPDATKEAKDTLLEKQFFLLEKLLLDECPDVRVVAVEGSCRILHMFWEIIPSPTITKIITKIFDCMTHDACTEVRLSTVNGVIYLLGNPQSHEVLKVLLPRLGSLITDSASAVRAALADLLLLLNDIRNFQFHKASTLDLTLDHLLHCAYNVVRENNKHSGKPLSESLDAREMTPGECQSGTSLTEQIRLSNLVKALTAVLKFIVDATTMNLAPSRYQERCLNFATENLKFIITNLREHSVTQLQVTEEDRKDIFICLKSSFTYTAKLLNAALKAHEVSLPQAGGQGLTDELFNLFVSVEEFLGYGFAARLIPIVQPWIPDLVLALGSGFLLKETPDEGPSFNSSDNAVFPLPSWFYILARTEICELRDDAGLDEETERVGHHKDFPAFKRLVETMCKLLKANNEVLDAAGARFLSGALSALTSKNFDVVLGILHFVYGGLVGTEEGKWEGFKLMLACLGEIYSAVEKEKAVKVHNNEGDREKLYSAMALIEPVWKSFIYDGERRNVMEEE